MGRSPLLSGGLALLLLGIALAGAWILDAAVRPDGPSSAGLRGTAPIEEPADPTVVPSPTTPAEETGNDASEPPAEAGGCLLPSVRATYLPWRRHPPTPERDRDAQWAVVSWHRGDVSRPDGPPLEGYVLLSRSSEDLGALPADPRVPPLLGRGGRIYRGMHDVTIVWPDPFPPPVDDRCNETALTVNLSKVPYGRVLREAIRVARSLEPV